MIYTHVVRRETAVVRDNKIFDELIELTMLWWWVNGIVGVAPLPWVDGAIRLQEIHAAVGYPQLGGCAVKIADDAEGDRVVQSERVAQCDDPIANLQRGAVAHGGYTRQFVVGAGLDAHQRDIRERIGPHDARSSIHTHRHGYLI